jgi:hypothetical protein
MSATSDLSDTKQELLARCLREGRGGNLKEILRRQESREYLGDGVVAIHPSGNSRPFFFLHGDYTLVQLKHWFLSLGKELGPEQPFYALDPGRLDEPVAPALDAFAAAHIRRVRAIQPRGPYVLGGSCNGGLVAFEMARQFQRDGDTVSLLILVEPFVVTGFHRLGRKVLGRLGGLIGLTPDKQLDWFLRILPLLEYPSSRLRYVQVRLRLQDRRSFGHLVGVVAREFKRAGTQVQRLAQMRCKRGPSDAPICRGRPLDDYPGIFRWMAADYVLRPYAGQVALYWTSTKFEEKPVAPSQWLGIAEGAEVHIVPGMVTLGGSEHAYDIAAHWRACLSRVVAGSVDRG